MPVREITILLSYHQERIDCFLPFAEPGRRQCRQWVIPTPRLIPFPFRQGFGKRSSHRLRIRVVSWKKAKRSQHRRVIDVALRECLRTVFVRQVNSITGWQRRKLFNYLVPFSDTLHTETLPPALSNSQCEFPVR